MGVFSKATSGVRKAAAPAPAPAAAAPAQLPPDALALLGQLAPTAGAPAPYAGPITPEQDPVFLAFQRAMGYESNELAAQAIRAKQTLATGMQLRSPEYDRQLESGQKSIEHDYMNRGMYGSAHRLVDLHKQREEVEGRRSKDWIETQGRMGDIDAELAAAIANNQRRVSEEALTAQQRIAVQRAQGVLGPRIGA